MPSNTSSMLDLHNSSRTREYDEAILRVLEKDKVPWSADKVTLVIILLLSFIVYCVLIIFLLLHGTHRRQLNIQLAASCILAHLPAAIFVHPGSIHVWILKRHMAIFYCWFWSHIVHFTEIIIPYTLMMFSIERLMYIRNPIAHAQKINRAGRVTLLAFPWIVATILSIIYDNYELGARTQDFIRNDAGNITLNTCETHGYFVVHIVVRGVFGMLLPLFICIIITIVVLGMWCCFKRKHALGRDYSMMGDEVLVIVRNSVIAVSVLNFLFIITYFIEGGVMHVLWFRNAILNLYGMIEGLIWILAIGVVRNKCVALFPCSRKKPELETTAVTYMPNDTNIV